MTTAADTIRTTRHVRIAGRTLGCIEPLPSGDWRATLVHSKAQDDRVIGTFDSVRQARKAIVYRVFNTKGE